MYDDEADGSRIGQFQTRRGVLMSREFRDIGRMNCKFGSMLFIETLICTTLNTSAVEVQYGVLLRVEGYEEYDGTVRVSDASTGYLDFDEVEELIGAVEYVAAVAKRLQSEQRDYTEINYVGRGAVRFGFYQRDNEQQLHINVGRLPVYLLEQQERVFSLHLQLARKHLSERGAPIQH